MLEEFPSPPTTLSDVSTLIRLTGGRPSTTPASTQHDLEDRDRCRRHPDRPPSPRRRRRCHPGSSRRRRRCRAELDDRDVANERERARMKTLSRAFSRLKAALPWVPADTKLSKLDTLRLATSYIAHLSEMLRMTSSGSSLDGVSGAETEEAGTSNHNKQKTLASNNTITTMSWPFARSSRRLALSRLQTTTTTTTTDDNSKSTKR